MKKIWIIGMCVLLIGCASPIEKDKPTSKDNSQTVTTTNNSNTFTYHRDHLNETEKALYDTLYTHMMQHDESYAVKATSEESLTQSFHYIAQDHPEMFWYDHTFYSYSKRTEKDQDTYVIHADETYTAAKIETLQKSIDTVCEPIIAHASTLQSEYEKVKYVYDTIIDSTAYVTNSQDNQNIVSVFLNHQSVCAGYAKSIQYLLNKMGIPCTYITGVTKDGNREHAWNMVQMDDAYYYIDATNGDIADPSIDQRLRYSYFAFNTSQMLALYEPKDAYEETSAYENTYFYQNDLYLEKSDPALIEDIISKQEDPSQVIFQCSLTTICEDLSKQLEEEQLIFKYMKQAGVSSEKYRSYHIPETSVWLYEMQ